MSDSYLPENDPGPGFDPFASQPTPTPPPTPPAVEDDEDLFARPTPMPPAPVAGEGDYPDLTGTDPDTGFDPFSEPAVTRPTPAAPAFEPPAVEADDPYQSAAEAVMSGSEAPAPVEEESGGLLGKVKKAKKSRDPHPTHHVDDDGPGLPGKLLLPGVALGALAVGFLGAGLVSEPKVETIEKTVTKTVEQTPKSCETLASLASGVTDAGTKLGAVAGAYSKLIVPTFKAGQANNKAKGAKILAKQKALDATVAEQLKVIGSTEFAAAAKDCTAGEDGKVLSESVGEE